jgi:hypothetical protein
LNCPGYVAHAPINLSSNKRQKVNDLPYETTLWLQKGIRKSVVPCLRIMVLNPHRNTVPAGGRSLRYPGATDCHWWMRILRFVWRAKNSAGIARVVTDVGSESPRNCAQRTQAPSSCSFAGLAILKHAHPSHEVSYPRHLIENTYEEFDVESPEKAGHTRRDCVPGLIHGVRAGFVKQI